MTTAAHSSTVIKFDLLQAPDVTNTQGHGLLSERAQVHIYDGIAWIWVEGRAVRKDGSIGTGRRGTGYDLAGATLGRDWRPAPDWVREHIATDPAVSAYITALGGLR